MTQFELETVPLEADLGAREASRDLGGLLALVDDAQRPLPLQRVRVRTNIAGDGCRTVMEQVFANHHEAPMEALYVFPLPHEGAVVEMELEAGDRLVRAECRERAAAERAYEEALRSGHRAALLAEQRPDVYTVRVGGLPPGTDVTVRLSVFERLEHRDGRFLWRFPTVIAPRYLPGRPIGHEGPGVLPDTDRVPDASRLQPPLRLEGGTALDLEVELAGPVTEVSSSLHAVRVQAPGDEAGWRIAPAGSASLDRDFVLAFSSARPDATASRAWSDGAHTLVVVEPPSDGEPTPIARDAVFVIDVSGSMAGSKLEAAKLALSTALHGLAPGDRFALLAFESALHPFEDGRLLPYANDTVARADAWIRTLAALGGTEMLAAVRRALGDETTEGRLRTVLLITDGEVWNDAELLAAVAHRRGGARLFALGIDTVSTSLLPRLAHVGGGTCEMLAPSDDIEAAVARMEARFGSPIVDGVSVAGGEPADPTPRTLYAGHPVSLLLAGSPERLTVAGRTPTGAYSETVTVQPIRMPLGALWARERVGALETRIALHPSQEEGLRAEILQVALAHGIVSRFTALVALDRSVTSAGEAVEVVQPVQMPHAWEPLVVAESHALGSYDVLSSGIDADGNIACMSIGAPRPRLLQAFAVLPHEDSPPVRPDPAGAIARRLNADGSIDGDVQSTAAGLAVLVLLGHTRRRGLRRRAVAKLAGWLAGKDDAAARLALEILREAESGADLEALGAHHAAELERLPGFSAWRDEAFGPTAPGSTG